MAKEPERFDCCIAGGGPAGLMLGLLLARAGIKVAVFEKHEDFLRDFRGDTIHPSTLEILHELGLLADFLKLPHRPVSRLEIAFGADILSIADFSHLPTRCRFIALMPQWDFLNFLARAAEAYPNFRLFLSAEATGLIEEKGRIGGIEIAMAGEKRRFLCDLVVAADGRHSVLRKAAGLRPIAFGAPMDVLWFRLDRRPEDPAAIMGRIGVGRIMVMLDRGDYWQCAWVIPKGRTEAVKAAGLAAFRAGIEAAAPFLKGRTEAIADWESVKLLSVSVDRLAQWWRPGFLCIGDAAHAMSPLGGVGINLAIQDAVAAANLLAGPLAAGSLGEADLRRVQRRREGPMRAIQRLQLFLQKAAIAPVLESRQAIRPPFFLRWFDRCPMLRRLPARLIGLGLRPEHVAKTLRPS